MKIKKKLKVLIPNNRNEITLEQFQKWAVIFENESNQGTYFAKQKCIEIFCKIPIDIVLKMKHSDVNEIYDYINTLLDEDTKSDFNRVFIFKGIEFGMIPNFEKMSSGEYADMTDYLHKIKDWHRMLACMFRPVSIKKTHKHLKYEQYLIDEYEGSDEYSGLMKDLPMDIVLGSLFFLISSFEKLRKDLMLFTQRELNKNPGMIRDLPKNMDGSTIFTSLPALTSSTLNQLLKFQSWKP